jgi:hypothetical protein
MTHEDLATLLRADVSAAEPQGGLDPSVPMRLGRRRLHTRLAVGGVAVVALVAMAIAAPFALLDTDHPTQTTDPAPYDAEEMPRIMDEHVRMVLDRDVGSLGPVTFSAQTDTSVEELPPGRYDEAARMQVQYGEVVHRYEVTVLHAGSEAEGPVRKICHGEMASHLSFGCFVTREHGMFVVTTVRAYQPAAANPLNDRVGYTVVRTNQLDQVEPGRLFFARTVKVIKSDTLLTYVTERVRARSLLAANRAWKVPVEHLVEIGIDPALAIPVPEAH